MEDLKFKGDKNPKIKSKIDDSVLKYRLNKDDLTEPDVFERFVKDCEYAVRHDPRYANYISHLKTYGFNFDVLQYGLNNEKFPDLPIEMHHGPIFNLYEICSIVIDHMLNVGMDVTTFDVAKAVLDEHECHNIQVTMLTKTNHELAHDGKVFIHLNQCFGEPINFIKNYKRGIRREHLYSLEKYINLCKEYDATDNDYLELSNLTKKIKKYL